MYDDSTVYLEFKYSANTHALAPMNIEAAVGSQLKLRFFSNRINSPEYESAYISSSYL